MVLKLQIWGGKVANLDIRDTFNTRDPGSRGTAMHAHCVMAHEAGNSKSTGDEKVFHQTDKGEWHI